MRGIYFTLVTHKCIHTFLHKSWVEISLCNNKCVLVFSLVSHVIYHLWGKIVEFFFPICIPISFYVFVYMLNQNFYRIHSFTEIYSNNITSGKGILNILGMMIDDKTLFGGKRILNIFGPLVCHAHSLFDTFYIKGHWPLIKVVAYLQKSFNEKDSFFFFLGKWKFW